jgi:hypothetical protein
MAEVRVLVPVLALAVLGAVSPGLGAVADGCGVS